MSDGLNGKRVVITAGADGIGRAMARAFMAAGSRVHICDVAEDKLAAMAAEAPDLGTTLADVADEAQVGRLFDEAVPGSAAVELAAAGLEAAAGRAENVREIYRQVLRRWPQHPALIDEMLAADSELAKSAIEEAYQADPRRPWMRYLMARLAESGGDFQRAAQLYEGEGSAAAQAGDYRRMLRSQQALDRARNPPPPHRHEEPDPFTPPAWQTVQD